jgi:hypothetical protein
VRVEEIGGNMCTVLRQDAAADGLAEVAGLSEQELRERVLRLNVEMQQRAKWEADAAAAEAARLRYERDRAAWAAEVAACQRSPRSCVANPDRY